MNQKNILIIFAKNLVHGKVKTRLASSIGVDHAFAVYKELLYRTKSIVQNVNADKIVYYSDQVELTDIWDDRFLKAKQQGLDLGERMRNAFNDSFQRGYSKAVIIGTDCPSLNKHIIQAAFEDLDHKNVVIGPAYDGGYYLLGMKVLYEDLFQNVAWSTKTVFETTITISKHFNLTYSVLPLLHDIDEERDLEHLKNASI
jgi:rSAM/selenodomain-associated transferase 1